MSITLCALHSLLGGTKYMPDDSDVRQHLLNDPNGQNEANKGISRSGRRYDSMEDCEEAPPDEYAYEKTVQVGHFCDHEEDANPEEMRSWWRKNGIQPLGVGDISQTFKSKSHKSSSTLNIVAACEETRSPTPPNDDGSRAEAIPKRKSVAPVCGRPGRIKKVVRFVLEDWFCLAFLGIIMAVLSMLMDAAIENLQNFHLQLYDLAKAHADRTVNIVLTYLVWMLYAVILTSFSAIFVHYVAPQAIGSGIPEMKTILRGVILKEYLTFRTLVSKMIGLTLSLGSGLPIGKEGPFVHVASVVANLLSNLMHSANGVYANESRSTEMLAAGCAVGVACTFSAPVGGVLFSIEVTSVYFAVRSYWRGFFAAACSATLFRLLKVWLNETEVTVVAFYQTSFPREAFFPEELPVFAFIGLICGLAGALFVLLHRSMVTFLRRNGCAKRIFQKYWIVYPICVSFVVATLTYPQGFGSFLAGDHKFSQTLKDFFVDCTWLTAAKNGTNACSEEFVAGWRGYLDFDNSILVVLACFQITYFFLAALSSTLPIPAGIFMPVFVIGAAFGRMIGELMVLWFPEGIRGEDDLQIFPGVYAVVGAAAFCGAVTHTVSVAVIVFELTGQLLYILPVMISVLIANAICSYLQPSIYDSIIKIKHLPFLPHIPHTSSIFHGICAKQFMVSNIRYLSKESTYREVEDLLDAMPKVKAFPVVEDNKSVILLGSASRSSLARAVERRVGPEARQTEAARRIKETIEDAERRFKTAPIERRISILDSHLVTSLNPLPTISVSPPSTVNSRKTSTMNRFTVTKVTEATDHPQDLLKLSPVPNTKTDLKRSSSETSIVHDTLYHTIGGVFRTLQQRLSFGRMRNHGDDYDLHGDEREAWELMRLGARIDLDDIGLDAAPFQVVPRSSLFKVHSLFSLLGLNRAYVTQCGRLTGVIALRELRLAIERAQLGLLSADSRSMWDSDEVSTSDTDVEACPGTESSHDDEADDLFHLGPRLEVVSRVSSSRFVPALDRQTSEFPSSELEKKAEKEDRELKEKRERRRTMSTTSDPCLIAKLEQLKWQDDLAERENRDRSSFESVKITISDDEEEDCLPKGDMSDISEEDDVFEPPKYDASSRSSRSSEQKTKKKKNNHVTILVPDTPIRSAAFNYGESHC